MLNSISIPVRKFEESLGFEMTLAIGERREKEKKRKLNEQEKSSNS